MPRAALLGLRYRSPATEPLIADSICPSIEEGCFRINATAGASLAECMSFPIGGESDTFGHLGGGCLGPV